MAPVKLDLDITRANLNDDSELIRIIATVVIEDLPSLVSELQAACVSHDRERVRLVAHSIKGLGATFHAEPLMQFAETLERGYLELAQDEMEALAGQIESVQEGTILALTDAIAVLPSQ